MIDPTTSPQYYGGTTTSSGTTSKSTLDKDAFMKLLVAQLSHQDPLSPLQPDQMAAQLAQFTSVEQLTKLNDAMALQTQASQVATLASQSALSASLLGRQIEAVGNQVLVPSTGHGEILADIGGTGGRATLTLTDTNGKTIATRDLGNIKPGISQTIQLPNDLPPGTWKYTLTVKGQKDAPVAVTTYSSGVVTGVEFKNGEIVLQAGGLEISLSDLVRIAPSASGSSTSTNNPTSPKSDRGEDGPLGGPVGGNDLPGDGFRFGGITSTN